MLVLLWRRRERERERERERGKKKTPHCSRPSSPIVNNLLVPSLPPSYVSLLLFCSLYPSRPITPPLSSHRPNPLVPSPPSLVFHCLHNACSITAIARVPLPRPSRSIAPNLLVQLPHPSRHIATIPSVQFYPHPSHPTNPSPLCQCPKFCSFHYTHPSRP